jgi:hypothetical protein
MIVARWIGLGRADALQVEAAYRGLALAQSRDAAPVFLWAQARTDMWLGQRAGLAGDEAASIAFRPSPAGLLPVEASRHLFILIVPKRLAPGRESHWLPWALAPMLATYRHFGLPAYLDGEDVWLHGRRVAHSGATVVGECAVIASSFMPRFAREHCEEGPEPGFRSWLREGLSLAESECADVNPAGRVLEDVFRARIEAQLGWQFEHSWPSGVEIAAIERLKAPAELESAT